MPDEQYAGEHAGKHAAWRFFSKPAGQISSNPDYAGQHTGCKAVISNINSMPVQMYMDRMPDK